MFPELIKEIIDLGVEITVRTVRNDKDIENYVFDLNIGAKSHLWLVYEGVDDETHEQLYTAYMRYGETELLVDPDIEDIMYIAKRCMMGRDYIDERWERLMIRYGVMRKHVEMKVTYT